MHTHFPPRDAAALRSPHHHVRRPRLTAALTDAPVGVVEAGAGYGKTALAAEFSDDLAAATVRAVLQPGDTHPRSLVARLHLALRRAGIDVPAWTDPASPEETVEAVLSVLATRSQPVLVVIDNVNYASACGHLLLHLATELAENQRLLVAGRRLPAGASSLRTWGHVARLDGADLAFTPAEVAALMAHRSVAVSDGDATRLQQATGGWAAALVVAAPQLERAVDPGAAVARLEDEPTVPAVLVNAALGELAVHERSALVQAAHLPFLLPEVVAAATGVPGLLDVAMDAGVPLHTVCGGAMVMPDPVREHLAALAPFTGEVARSGAKGYSAAGHPLAAVDTLMAAGLPADAARVLAELPLDRVDRLDHHHVRRVVAALPAAVLRDQPAVLLRAAAACEMGGHRRARLAALRQAARAVDPDATPGLAREIHAEFAIELCRYGRWHEAAALAGAVLAGAGQDERATRVQAARGLSEALCAVAGPAGRLQADELLTGAIGLCPQLAEPARVARVLAERATLIAYAAGRHSQAIAGYDEALTAVRGRPHQRAGILVLRARALIDCGRSDEADADLAEAHQLADVLADPWLIAQIALARATAASQSGEAKRTVAQLHRAEQHRDEWFDSPAGAGFLAEAAQLADRVGEACAWTYLERALERVAEDPFAVALAEGMVHARSGDPGIGEARLAALVAGEAVVPRERWRVQLARAAAAHRRGDPRAGMLAASAFDDAAALTAAALPLVRERVLAGELADVAASAGSACAARYREGDLAATITVLGDFRVMWHGRDLTPLRGHGAQLVKLLAVSGGRAHVEAAAEVLWPETAPGVGRRRLRNVLNRLRTTSGDLVVREGQCLTFSSGARVDLILFDREAQEALANPTGPRAVALSRSASTRCRGTLLPDDLYVEWSAAPRERAQRRQLALLRLLAAAAEARDDIDDAVRLLERAIDVDARDEDLYLQAARLLLIQGRRGRARRMLDDAQAVAASLGVAVSRLAADLESQLS